VTGKIKEPALAKIPPRLLAAFLAQLKEQLKT
jgi:hypothetical protein